MLSYRYVSTLVASKAGYSSNVSDLMVVDGATGPVLISCTASGNSLSYGLGGALDPAVGINRREAPDYGLTFGAARMAAIERDGRTQILYSGLQDSLHSALSVEASGKLGGFVSLFPTMPDDIVAMNVFEIAGTDYMLAGRNGTTAMMMFRLDAGATATRLAQVGPPPGQVAYGEYTDIDTISINGAHLAVAASAQGNLLAVFSVSATGLVLRGYIDGGNTVGLNAPRAVETVTTAHGSFLIVTGGESDSVTVFRVQATGAIALTDHVVDSGTTRFQAATAIATAEIGGRAFIFLGGADDGISVMTLDGQGRLILLSVIEDSTSTALADISALEARVIGGQTALFVASGTEGGVTQFSFDPGTIGVSRTGSGRFGGTPRDDVLVGTGAASTLVGGGGDDILIAREGVANLQGGSGRDIFVPGFATTLVTIHDFMPGYDRLDLSELAFIRSVTQLQITATSTGAALSVGPLRIEIITTNGTMLPPGFFTNEMFRLSHYANKIDYKDLVEPLSGPSVPPKNGGGDGYTVPPPAPPPPPVTPVRIGTAGNDRIQLPGGNGQVHGLGGADLIVGGWGKDRLLGGLGNDTVRGGDGADHVLGDAGNDSLLGQSGDDRISGGTGHDLLEGGLGNDRLFGLDQNDTLMGQAGSDVLMGGAGHDLLYGGDGNDLLIGGAGADRLFGEDGHDRLIAKGGNARVFGGPGNDRVELGIGWNLVQADDGRDSVFGGDGGDRITLGAGDDIAYGRMGTDTISGDAGHDRIFGGGGNDRLTGNAGNDRVYGDAGDDLLDGVIGDDLLYGLAGRDTLVGGEGRDTLEGGIDSDLLWGGAGDDDLSGGYGVDKIHGQAGLDRLRGGTGSDWLDGGEGNDTLFGELNEDHLLGGGGDDLLFGHDGRDTLSGGAGSDTLIGGPGRDILTGDLGADVFVFAPGPDDPAKWPDLITDFQSGTDQIDLTPFARPLLWIDSDTFSASGQGEVRIDQLSDRVQLVVDRDGDGSADFRVDVVGVVGPSDLLI